MPRQHIWTEKDEEGRRREVRATKFGGKWQLQAKSSDETGWTHYDPPLLGDLLKLREILGRKYQRRRASTDDLESLDKLIGQQQ